MRTCWATTWTPCWRPPPSWGRTVFQPHSDPGLWADRDGIARLADDLAEVAGRAAQWGLRVGYHNHEFEFTQRVHGRPAYEYFLDCLDPAVVVEIDTFWAAFGGVDPLTLLAEIGDRVTAVHLKDGRLGERGPNQVLGTGEMDIHSLVGASAGTFQVIEFDDCDGDIFTALGASLDYLRGTER